MGHHRIGFISTRLAGMDGVSLETRKWAEVFEQEGYPCYYMAGELDHPPERSFLVEEAHFNHPEVLALQEKCFGVHTRKPEVTKKIHELKDLLKQRIYDFIQRFELDLLVPQNALAIPMNIPLGLALTEVISESGIQTIAHHHDFFWKRQRFLTNAVWEYLNMAFPPHLPTIRHVVINSSADNQLSLRTGISATLIPNIMDFETPAPLLDDYASDVRQVFGIEDDELLILQPTRVVQRKGIEHAIELVSRLDMKCRLVISHASGDEGFGYERRVRDYSEALGVNTLFICNIIDDERGTTADGKKIYSLDDIYPHADLVTYPSTFEGFGNAFLEAVYFHKPVVVNNYSIYSYDIKPKGFNVIEFDGYITPETVEQTREVLTNRDLRKEMVEQNYTIALRHYSYSVLRQKLRGLLTDCFGR